MCDKNEIGDEFHYVLVCPHFADQRKKLLGKGVFARANAIAMYHAFDQSRIARLKKLAKLVKCIQVEFSHCRAANVPSVRSISHVANVVTRSGRPVKQRVVLDL